MEWAGVSCWGQPGLFSHEPVRCYTTVVHSGDLIRDSSWGTLEVLELDKQKMPGTSEGESQRA